jgi:hypothetical protein
MRTKLIILTLLAVILGGVLEARGRVYLHDVKLVAVTIDGNIAMLQFIRSDGTEQHFSADACVRDAECEKRADVLIAKDLADEIRIHTEHHTSLPETSL